MRYLLLIAAALVVYTAQAQATLSDYEEVVYR
jgi:hypothetical protein